MGKPRGLANRVERHTGRGVSGILRSVFEIHTAILGVSTAVLGRHVHCFFEDFLLCIYDLGLLFRVSVGFARMAIIRMSKASHMVAFTVSEPGRMPASRVFWANT